LFFAGQDNGESTDNGNQGGDDQGEQDDDGKGKEEKTYQQPSASSKTKMKRKQNKSKKNKSSACSIVSVLLVDLPSVRRRCDEAQTKRAGFHGSG
jgi:hypothetical protein